MSPVLYNHQPCVIITAFCVDFWTSSVGNPALSVDPTLSASGGAAVAKSLNSPKPPRAQPTADEVIGIGSGRMPPTGHYREAVCPPTKWAGRTAARHSIARPNVTRLTPGKYRRISIDVENVAPTQKSVSEKITGAKYLFFTGAVPRNR